MTRRADFNAEEWRTVMNAPIYAALRVITASRGGMLRESFAVDRAYKNAREHHGESELLDDVVESGKAASRDADEIRHHPQSESAEVVTQQLRDAIRIVGTKATPSETDSYKTFVVTVAQAAASAHKEGGLLGMGGKRISDAESQALDEISTALGRRLILPGTNTAPWRVDLSD